MRHSVFKIISFGLLFFCHHVHTFVGPVIPGQSLWGINKREAETLDIIESKVCLQDSQLDVIESIVEEIESKVCVQDSQLDVIESKIDEIVIADNGSQLDVIESKICEIESIVEEIESKVDELLLCEPGPIESPGTISASGFYCLANEIVGSITIAVSDVVLDLNNYRVTQGIIVNGDLDQITIRNGVVEGMTDAIRVNGGSTNINVENVTAKNAIHGINFENVTGGRITNCEMTMNTTGLELGNSHKINVIDCVAACNVNAGFCLLSSTTNCFENCKALSTGEGNSEIMAATVFGFVSKDGVGNIFERCIANSTQSLTVTDTDSLIAGFALRGTEGCSKIIECEAANSMTNPSGASIPYGILIEPTVPDMLTTQTAAAVFSGNIGQLTWSPDGKFIAAATDSDDPIRLRIFSFDRTTKLLTQVATPDVIPSGSATDLSWSLDGSLLAEVRDDSVREINIYTFDPANNSLHLRNNFSIASEPESIVWSPDGKFLAVGTNGVDGISIYRFDKNTFSLTLVASIGTPDRILSIDWALTDNLIVGGSESCVLRIFSFDITTNTLTALATNAGSPLCAFNDLVSWSPDHKFIMSTGALYAYDSDTDTLTLLQDLTTGLVPFFNDWSSDGNYFVAGSVDIPITMPAVIQVFEVDRGAQTAEVVASVSATEGSMTELPRVSWSPDGEYIAFSQPISGDTPTIDILVVADAFTFPKKNVIVNNTVYCNSGNECPGGFGISGSSISNYIVGNTGYNNPFNYAFVTNAFSQNTSNGSVPSALQNISIGGCEPICIPDNVGLLVRQVCAKNELLSSQIEVISSQVDVIGCNVTPLDQSNISGGTISITASGNYCVAEDLTTDFAITATCVTLDLNGRCITGIMSISTSDDITITNGNMKPPAPTSAPSAGITVAATVNRTVISDVLVQCADTVTAGVAGRTAVELHGNDGQLLNCTLKAGAGADASGTPGTGGDGLLIDSDASKTFVSKCIIASGRGGSSTSATGATGGHGISIESNAQNSEIIDTIIFCTGSGGNGGDGLIGGDGGHGIFIASTVIDASVRNCTIRNTGAGGTAGMAGTSGVGGKAVDDNVTTTANLSLIFANFAHNIANAVKFDLQAGGVETGVLTPNPPTSTVVNPLANVYAS